MGQVRPTNVTRHTDDDVLLGRGPEVLGTISIVVESDLTPFSTVNSMMDQLAGSAKGPIANLIENLGPAIRPIPTIPIRIMTISPTILSQPNQPLTPPTRPERLCGPAIPQLCPP